jgi:starch synthase
VTEKPRRGQPQNGFVFVDYSTKELLAALARAGQAYADGKKWPGLVQNAFATDFTWTRSAGEYVKLYEAALQKV